jgi:hypothetical protein
MSFDITTNLKLPVVSANPDNAARQEMIQTWDAIRNLALSMDDRTGAVFVVFSETATYGQLVNLYNSGGVLNARLSNLSTSAKPVRGYCAEPKGVLAGSTGLVLATGRILSRVGLTPGALYYGSNSAGAASISAGTVTQAIGFALSSTELYIQPTLI